MHKTPFKAKVGEIFPWSHLPTVRKWGIITLSFQTSICCQEIFSCEEQIVPQPATNMSPSLWISQDYFPATAPPSPSFPDEPKFLDSLPDVSRFLCLMFPDFFAWCFLICLPNVSRLLDVPCFFSLMYPIFLAWCFPISLLDIFQCLCRISLFLFPTWTIRFLAPWFFLQFKLSHMSQRFSPQNIFLPSFLSSY